MEIPFLSRLTADADPDDNRESEPEPCDLEIDAAMHLARNRRRRLAIDLVEELGEMEIGALADAIATIADEERKSVYVALYQSHLPKLDKHDVINLGPRGHHVDPGPHFDVFYKFVDEAEKRFTTEETNSEALEYDEDLVVIGGDVA